MTSSTLEDLIQAQVAPTEESVREEVIVVKEPSLDNFVFKCVEFGSYNYQLGTQAHLLHLNIECPSFLAIHKYLKKQYLKHLEDFDKVGELVRSMDYLLPMCQKGLLGAFKDFKHLKSYDHRDALVRYVKNLENGGYMAKDLYKMAGEVECHDGENIIAEIINTMFKSAWMLKSTLRD